MPQTPIGGEIKEAAFLFYAAPNPETFDYKRLRLGNANGENVETYWGFLNQASVSPKLSDNPQFRGSFLRLSIARQMAGRSSG